MTAAALLGKYLIHKYLLMAAVGLAIHFGSLETDSLLYVTYPPFVLVTVSFMLIGSYLAFSGIDNSAIIGARDKTLRKEFYTNAVSQLELLKAIGVTEMERSLYTNLTMTPKNTYH